MKKRNIALAGILILSLFGTQSTAQQSEKLTLNANQENSLSLKMTNHDTGKIEIMICDERGTPLYEESIIKQGAISRSFNLRQLPQGKYSLLIGKGRDLDIAAFSKENNKILLAENKMKTIVKPTFRQHAQYVDLNMLCNWNDEVVLQMTDSEGRILYTETIQVEGSALQRRFNLSELAADSYSISVRLQNAPLNREFSELIKWSPKLAAN